MTCQVLRKNIVGKARLVDKVLTGDRLLFGGLFLSSDERAPVPPAALWGGLPPVGCLGVPTPGSLRPSGAVAR